MRLRVGPLLIAAEMQVEHRDGRAGRQLHLVFYLMLFDGPVAEIAEDPAAESGPRAARSLVRRTRGLDFQSIRDLSGNAHRTPPVSGHHPLHNVMYSRPMTDSRQRPIVPGAHFAFAISDERYAPRVPRSSRLAAQLLKIDYGASVGAGMRGSNRGHERMSADGVTLVTGLVTLIAVVPRLVRPDRASFLGAKSIRRFGAHAEEEFIHFPFEKFAGLGLHRCQAILIDQHRLMLQPL